MILAIKGNGKNPIVKHENNDVLSLCAGGNFDDSEGEYGPGNPGNISPQGDDCQLRESTRKTFQERFELDACIEKAEKMQGISSESSQKEVLKHSYRAETPNNVTAYAEECR